MHRARLAREEYQLATLCAMFANAHSGKGGKKYKTDDFMLTKPERKKQSVSDTVASLEMLAASMALRG